MGSFNDEDAPKPIRDKLAWGRVVKAELHKVHEFNTWQGQTPAKARRTALNW